MVNAIKIYSALFIAIIQITDNTKQSDIRTNGLCIIYHMESFGFIFAMQILNPIFNLILHKSTVLQSLNINLLRAIAICLVRSLKKSKQSMRNDENDFKNKKQLHEENCIILFLLLKTEKILSIIDMTTNQHVMSSQKDEMRVNVYYKTFDQLIAGLNFKFNQETLKMINIMGHLLKLEIHSDDIFLLSSVFDLDAVDLETKIRIQKESTNLSESNKAANCEKWIDCLAISKTSRKVIFCDVYILAIKLFV